MDDGLIIVLDYDKICRLCLQTKGVMSDIFVKDDEVPLTMQIKLVTSVEVRIIYLIVLTSIITLRFVHSVSKTRFFSRIAFSTFRAFDEEPLYIILTPKN